MAGAGTPGREGTPMLTVVPDVAGALPAGEPLSLIDQIVREGARQMLAAALQAEVAAYIDQFGGVRDADGRRVVVRNGTAEPRIVVTSAGAVEVTAPRVNDKRTDPATGERKRFSSAILPRGRARPRRSARCCRCCTCTACPAGTSCPAAVLMRTNISDSKHKACLVPPSFKGTSHKTIRRHRPVPTPRSLLRLPRVMRGQTRGTGQGS